MLKNFLVNEDGNVRPAAFYTIVALMIAGAAYGAYRICQGGDAQPGTLMACFSSGCGYHTRQPLQLGQTMPDKCPKCGQMTFAGAYACPQCGTINVWNVYQGKTGPDRCSKCNREVRYGH